MTKQPSNRYKKDSKHVTTASQNQNAFEYLDEPRLKHAVRQNMRVHGHTAAANSYRCRKQLGPITPHTNDRHRASKEAHRGYNLSNRTSIGNRLKYADNTNQTPFEYLDENYTVRQNTRGNGSNEAATNYRSRKQLEPNTQRTNERRRASKDAHRDYNPSNRNSIDNSLRYTDNTNQTTFEYLDEAVENYAVRQNTRGNVDYKGEQTGSLVNKLHNNSYYTKTYIPKLYC